MFNKVLGGLIWVASLASALAIDTTALSSVKRADSSLVGYLGAFFLGADPDVYFYLSNGNNPNSFRTLNGGKPKIVPTTGTGGIRDPAIVAGQGPDVGKWFILGTDLDIAKTTWDASERTGSRGMFVYESTDLINWTGERLVTVEDETAGMVWAPGALWDESRGQYFTWWASRFYAESDTAHSGAGSPTVMRYAYTSDFKTFSSPTTYVDNSPASTIDLDVLALGGNSYARFLKNETATNVYMEVSDSGLFGTWTRPGGSDAIIRSGVEGPAVYWDNQVDGKAHLLLDYFGADGYRPFENTNVKTNSWTDSDRTGFPTNLRHGSVLPINQALYDALNV